MALEAELSWEQQMGRLPRRGSATPGLWRGVGLIALVVALWGGYALTGRPTTLIVGDRAYPLRTHHSTVATVLEELRLPLAPEDVVRPDLATELGPDSSITIQLARPVAIEADGRTINLLTHQQTPGAILAEAGIVTHPPDEILLDGTAVTDPESVIPAAASAGPDDALDRLFVARTPRGAVAAARPRTLRLIVHRAIAVTLNDGGASTTFLTTQPNVGEALLEQGLTLFLGDKVTPSLGTRLAPGMRIYIQRSTPVEIFVDGRTLKTRTHRETVEEVLAQAGVALMGQDYSRPAGDQAISAGDTLEVIRVRETIEIEQELIPFETSWLPDPQLEIDRQAVRQQGSNGVVKTRTRVRYENNQEVWREVEDEWLDQEPRNLEIVYGTNIVVRTLETEAGPVDYWRKIPSVVTAYSAATSGKEPDHPRYGITRSGLLAGFGIVAVDPKVIPLMTELYIPGYGRALAGDTGGLINGKRVDLGFEEDQLPENLYEWRDVYVLTPVPPADEIRYVLPQWPQRP